MDYICSFNIQCKDGEIYGWTVPVTIGYMPTEENIDLFLEDIDALTDEFVVVECIGVFNDRFEEVYKANTFCDDDMQEIYDVGMLHG